jgi:predicted metal-dependent hydrolase
MLGGGENPPGALELVDAAEALHPGRVDQVLLRCLAGHAAGTALGDAKVSVDGIARQVDSRVLGRHLGHVAIIPMNAGLQRGIDLFNSGRYWDAHEAWEHAWMPDRKGPDAGFYKGLIQVAAGCLHYGRSNRRGAVNKWRSGADYLRPYLPEHFGVRLAPLVTTMDEFLAAMKQRDWPDLTMPRIAQE